MLDSHTETNFDEINGQIPWSGSAFLPPPIKNESIDIAIDPLRTANNYMDSFFQPPSVSVIPTVFPHMEQQGGETQRGQSTASEQQGNSHTTSPALGSVSITAKIDKMTPGENLSQHQLTILILKQC